MSLSNVSAKLSDDSSKLLLIHRESGKVLEELPLKLATPTHRSFILATWVRSYASTARKVLSRTVYNAGEPSLAEAHWDKCLVVTSSDDEYTVHAWVCIKDGGLIHCYVVPELRRKGIARALIRGFCGPNVQYARPWPFDVPKTWTFNPYLLVH